MRGRTYPLSAQEAEFILAGETSHAVTTTMPSRPKGNNLFLDVFVFESSLSLCLSLSLLIIAVCYAFSSISLLSCFFVPAFQEEKFTFIPH